jgi:hypothetical protein
MTNDSSPAADVFVGAIISIPTIGVDLETTTTKPQTSTTRAGAGSTPAENSAVVTTTTLPDEEAGIAIPIEEVVPDTDGEGNGNDVGVSEEVVDVAYDMETESPVQEEKRKEDTASSLAVTAAVLISLLTAAAPALGAVSAAGAVGGVIGFSTSRSFAGGQLLPQVPKPTETAVESSILSLDNKRVKIPEIVSPQDVDLEAAFHTTSFGRVAKGATNGVGIAHVGRIFAYVISVLQFVSRVRILRPGLRRWAEIALVSPMLAAATPLLIVSFSGVLAALRTNDVISPIVTMLALFAMSILAPIFSLLIVVGWSAGRILSNSSLVGSVSEGLVLLPGVLFFPMMQRNLLGPWARSRSWEFFLALVLAPCVATLAYRNWLLHIRAVTASLCNKLVSSFEFVTPFDANYGSRLLGVSSESEALVVGIVMALLVMLVSVVALIFSDGNGKPEIMLSPFIKMESPVQILRREYIDLVKIKLGEPTRWNRWSRYGLAGLLSTFVLSEVLGAKSIVLVLVFLVVVAATRRFPRVIKTKEVHPIVKTVPMAAFGLLLGAVAVSPSRVFVAFLIVAVLAGTASFIHTRTLWDS